ncbi:MAG TPA: hypothetical protein VK176_15745 [Phycisphaerales bacterium]|nr:hypothetical protein [Phycisphaerales bacterium]
MRRKVKIAMGICVCSVLACTLGGLYWFAFGVVDADVQGQGGCSVLKYSGGMQEVRLKVASDDGLCQRLVAYAGDADARRGYISPESFVPGLVVRCEGVTFNFLGSHVIVNGSGSQRVRTMRDADRKIVEQILRELEERGEKVEFQGMVEEVGGG